MADVHQSFRVDLDRVPYNSSLARMETDTKVSTARTANEFKKIEKSVGGLRLQNVSYQAADIAVQLQGGAKAATVLAQQGSQILAAFGPSGALAGAVLAVGAGIYSWATNASAAEEKIKAVEKQAKVTAATLARLESGTDSDRQAAATASGKEAGAKERFEQRMEEIDEMEKKLAAKATPVGGKGDAMSAAQAGMAAIEAGRKHKLDAVANAKSAAEERLEAELDKDKRERDKKRFDEQDRMTENIVQEEAKLNDKRKTDQSNMMDLAKSIGSAEKKLATEKLGSVEYDKVKLQLLKDQNEIIDEASRLNTDNISAEEDAQEKQRKRIQGFEKINKEMEKMRSTMRDVKDIEEEIGREQKKKQITGDAAKGNATLKQAGEFLKSPDERNAEREAGQRKDRAIHRAISHQIDETDKIKDSEGRVVGRRGLSPDQREKIREREMKNVDVAKNEKKLTAAIDDDSIEKLVNKMQDVLDKLLAT